MTVEELINELKQFDGDMEVGFEHPSHDYWRNMLISGVDNVEEGYAKYSDYHSQLAVASEEEVEEFEYLEENGEGEDVPKSKRVTRMVVLK